jgi:hypothetical protein
MKKFSIGLLVSSSFLVLSLGSVASPPPAQAASLSGTTSVSSFYIPSDPIRVWFGSWLKLFGF